MDSLADAISELEAWVIGFSSEEDIGFSGLGSDYTESSERLNAALTGFSGSLTSLNDKVSASNTTLTGDLKAVNNQFMVVMNLLLDAMDSIESGETSDYYEDISDDVIDEARQGKVSSCVNHGTVDGDVNVAGVAGSMAIEYDLDPEDDISTSGNRSYNFKYRTQAILLSCINYGKVTSKKNYAGGMVGRMDLGTISTCENYGYISSTSGDYVGGITGESLSNIRKSFAKCFLSGRRYVGGIAGAGENIYDCYTLVKVLGDAQNSGAIAGEASGTLTGNYFVSDELAGVNRVSFSGKAEPISYGQLCLLEVLPSNFKTFSIIFIADDNTVKTITFNYGDSIDIADIPEVPEKAGYYGAWDKVDFTNIRFDEVVVAVYTRYFTTLASTQLRNDGQSAVLVDGQFLQENNLTATTDNISNNDLANADEYWTLSIPDDGSDSHIVRYQPINGDTKSTTIYVYSNGNWTQTETETMGNYLLFSAEGNDVQFAASCDDGTNTPLIILIALLIILMILLVVFRAAKLKKRRTAARARKEVTNEQD